MAGSKLFRKHVAIPQDHGSWVFILSPLLIGIFAGGTFSPATLSLIIAVLSAFLLRQPASMLIKIYSNRRTRDDLASARFWFVVYGAIALSALMGMLLEGLGYVIYLVIPGLLIFTWHLQLVSKREERRQVRVEVIATGVLSLSAPAAYWAGIGQVSPTGWWLWILVWLQSAASIVYAYLRLEQREWKAVPNRWSRFRTGFQPYLYTSFNLLVMIILGPGVNYLPKFLFIPYLVQWLETVWGIDHPAIGWKPARIGIRQLIVSTLWTVLFIVFWRPPWTN